ncbi:HNH endonuclease [Marivirga sp. S37H4]|uniref:HNH endonuclease n=1 Tax=Marivirga aurantiaca TaxID=2802615 RepID=A0A934WUX2_9BACT|nr:HNH endonuclease signature motif containing protein [Marivirga aurantiaca]MBK6263400.1 HNH endonuclease [Marivirga aurantiaca]
MAKHKFTYSEKYAVWETHGYCCYWCGDPLEIQQTTVDHVIPEHLEEKEDELNWVKEHYALPKEFEVNAFENWVPSHSNCNSRKSITLYKPSPAFIAILDSIIKKGSIARKKFESITKAKDRDKVIGKIMIDLEDGKITKDDLIALLGTTNEKVPDISEDVDGKLHIRVSNRWKVVNTMDNDLAMVSDGRMAGITPTNENPHISWSCPNCGSYGPWNGVMCMNCGMKSDPFD